MFAPKTFWIQPKNLWWWLTIVAVIVFPYLGVTNTAVPLTVIGLFELAITVAIFLLLTASTLWLLSKSRHAPEHGLTFVSVGFFFGAFISVGLTVWLSSGIGHVTSLFGTTIFDAAFGGAIPEETFKLLCVVFCYFLMKPWIKHPGHLMIIGMSVGLGFDIFENATYSGNAAFSNPNNDLQPVLTTWATRLLIGTFAHMIWTGITSWGLGQFIFNRRKTGLAWIFVPITIHFLFNTAWPFDQLFGPDNATTGTLVTTLSLYALSLGILVWLYRRPDTPRLDALPPLESSTAEPS